MFQFSNSDLWQLDRCYYSGTDFYSRFPRPPNPKLESAEASNTLLKKIIFMKWIIIGVCIYFTNPPEYKYTCQRGIEQIEICSDVIYTAGDSIFVNLNLPE